MEYTRKANEKELIAYIEMLTKKNEALEEFISKRDLKLLNLPVVSRSVWLVQDHHTLLIHGVFSTQQKAINFAGTSRNIAITNITVDG